MNKIGLVLAVGLLLSACGSGVNKAKCEGLYRAGKGIEGAVSVGVNLIGYRELLQKLATEISIAADSAASDSEREMVTAYRDALVAYKDAETIWSKSLSGPSRLNAFDPEIKRIAGEYPIDGEGVGANFSFDAKAAVQTIWQTAQRELTRGNRVYNGEE